MVTIGFDKSHNNYFSIGKGYTKLSQVLTQRGYETVEIDEFSQIENIDILVISFPQRAFNSSELKLLEKFISNGKKFVLLGEWGDLSGNTQILNSLSRHFGIIFNQDRICDPVTRGKVTVQKFSQHPILEGIHKLHMHSACSLKILDKGSAIARVGEGAWADEDIDYKHQPNEKKGDLPIIGLGQMGKSVLVGIGDASLFSDDELTGDHEKFALNLINWLSTV